MAEIVFADGPYFFPVTPFTESGAINVDLVGRLVDAGVGHGAGAVFAACGTGEFHALSVVEYEHVVAAAVPAVGGRVPLFTGAGGPLGHALETARVAERLGADGLLVLPPYLVHGSQAGLVAYVETIAAATRLPLVVYHRGNAQFTVGSVTRLFDIPTVVGIKDGVGDVALVQQFVLAAASAGRDLLFFNGLLTAEMSQAAYRSIGVPLYSSAVFAMAPDIATAWYRAYRDHDEAGQRRLLDGFYGPLVQLRDETPGFAVALIKAGLGLAGEPVGSVRPPLTDPTPEQLARLERILQAGRNLL